MAELRERTPVADWYHDFDHFDPLFITEPDTVWSDLRNHAPVAHSGRYGGLNVVTRWHDVHAVATDTQQFSSRRIIINELPTSHPGLPLPPINNDPPDHTAKRRAMLPFFNPVATKRWEDPVREICRRALDAIGERDDVDLAVDYAQVIPAELTAIMLGVDLEDVPQFRVWLHDLLEVGPTDLAVAKTTSDAMLAYMRGLLAARRVEPRDDLVTYLLDQRIDGEPISDTEMVNMLFLLLIAGIDTTWSGIGFSMMHLAAHPDDRRRLVAEPELIPSAVEEFLRFYPPVWVARVATSDTEVGGEPVAAGEWVLLGFPAANRDPEVVDRPDEVIIDRQANRHASFGLGVHRCLGSNLARMEMIVAIEEFLARYPDFELADRSGVQIAAGQVRGPRRVPARILAHR